MTKYIYIRQTANGYYNVTNNGKVVAEGLGYFGNGQAFEVANTLAKAENKKVRTIYF